MSTVLENADTKQVDAGWAIFNNNATSPQFTSDQDKYADIERDNILQVGVWCGEFLEYIKPLGTQESSNFIYRRRTHGRTDGTTYVQVIAGFPTGSDRRVLVMDEHGDKGIARLGTDIHDINYQDGEQPCPTVT